MSERPEAFPDGWTDVAHRENVGDGQVAHDGASYHAPLVVASVYHGRHVDGRAMGPRQRVQLLPEAGDDDRHVEAEDERDRYQIVVFLAILGQVFKPPVDQQSSIIISIISE